MHIEDAETLEAREAADRKALNDHVDDPEAKLIELAELPPIEYDRCRQRVAKEIGVRASTLDSEVEKRRSRSTETDSQHLTFDDLEPYDQPVDGADLLNEVASLAMEEQVRASSEVAFGICSHLKTRKWEQEAW